LLFIGLACLYVARAWGRFHWPVYVLMAGSALLVGFLFLTSWWNRRTSSQSGTPT
jgi:hypothetical protein